MTAARDRLGRGCRESRSDRSESSMPRPAHRSQRRARCARQNVVTVMVVAFAAFAFVAANGVTWVRNLNSSQTERLGKANTARRAHSSLRQTNSRLNYRYDTRTNDTDLYVMF